MAGTHGLDLGAYLGDWLGETFGVTLGVYVQAGVAAEIGLFVCVAVGDSARGWVGGGVGNLFVASITPFVGATIGCFVLDPVGV